MCPSHNDSEALQRRALQLEAREHALRAALRQRMSMPMVTPATLAAIALSTAAVAGLIGARGKRKTKRQASSGIGWLRGITLAVELGSALMSLAAVLGARRRDVSPQPPTHAEH